MIPNAVKHNGEIYVSNKDLQIWLLTEVLRYGDSNTSIFISAVVDELKKLERRA